MQTPTAGQTAPAAIPADTSSSRWGLNEVLLDAALQAQRVGSLEDLVRERPKLARWMLRRWLRVLSGTLGESATDAALPRLAALMLAWLTTQLRPDNRSDFEQIGQEAWLQLSSWRPMLAMASHIGYLRVPDFPRQYRRRSGEAALDNLCGLWGVGPSTLYRTLEKARHAMLGLLVEPAPDAARRLSLRQFALREETAIAALGEDLPSWHKSRAAQARVARNPVSALWHEWQCGDVDGFVQTLRKHAGALVVEPETEALVERMAASLGAPRQQVDLCLARAALARTRNVADRELRAHERAMQVAQDSGDPLLLGIVHSALGKYYEPRDADRAFACYQDSAEFLRDLGPERGDAQALEHFITTYARLAWLYLLRNDARSKAVLDRAEALRSEFRVPDDVLGMLEQVWGQYWRRAGEPARSLEHRFRALNIFERLGDQRSVLTAYVNISFDLAALGDYPRAMEYSQRILQASRQHGVDTELVVDAHLNIGAAQFWRGDFGAAIVENRLALEQSLTCDLRLHAFRARYNLAEAHYAQFRDQADPADEHAGDDLVAEILNAAGSESIRNVVEGARRLKEEVLGKKQDSDALIRLLPGEDAIHFDEMADVHSHRHTLSLPGEAQAHASAHLSIARAYLAISTKEREAARALIDKHGLQAQFVAEFAELQQTFARELTREQQLAAAWKQAAGDLVDDARRAGLIAHLLREGAVNKSGYGDLCGVSPATASKHLGLLTERGLLMQRGKGPSTRYELPA